MSGGQTGTDEPGGHAEGEWLPDATGGHQYRYFVHGQPTDFVSDSGVAAMDQHAEWRPDPAGRHQHRYFVRGQPTQAVSDNGVQSTDTLPLPAPLSGTPPLASAGRKLVVGSALIAGLAVLALVVVFAVVFLVNRGGGNGPDNDQVEQALRIAFFADQIEVECPDEAGNTPVGESFECDVTLADEDGQNETSFSVDAVKTDADTVHYQYEQGSLMVEGDLTLTDDGDPP